MATIGKPELLLLDEHTAALDPAAADKIMHITKDIVAHEKITAIMITRNIQSMLETGTKTIRLDRE